MVMPDHWAQTGDGMAEFVSELDSFLRNMLGEDARLPRVLVSDRGPGFYQATTGHIVEAYRRAAASENFRTFAGSDASKQPPDNADFCPHETAVSWLRHLMKKHPIAKGNGLAQMQKDFEKAMTACVKHINQNYDVSELCACFPRRVDELLDTKHEHLKH